MYCTKSMTVYYGTLSEKRKSGYSQWAKVILHVVPAIQRGNELITLDVMAQSVSIWIDDMFAEEIIKLESNGTVIPSEEGKASKGFKLTGDAIPSEYLFAFHDFGCDLHFKRVSFDRNMRKVTRDGLTVKRNGKAIISDHITVGYWTGGFADDSGSKFSEEYCTGRALAEWAEIRENIITVPTNDEDETEEETAN